MKKAILSVLAIALLSVSFVSAFGFGMNSFENNEEMQTFRDSVKEAVENRDFNSWKSLMESRLTQENFDNLVERHKEMSEVRALREELRDAIESGDDKKIEELKEQLSELVPGKSNKRFGRGGFFGRFRK